VTGLGKYSTSYSQNIENKNTYMSIQVFVKLVAKEGSAAQLEEVAKQLVEFTKSEPKTTVYDFYHNKENPNEFFVMEEYADEEVYKSHMDYFYTNIQPLLEPLLASAPVVNKLSKFASATKLQ
jgi:quinol monooxygenase YgiN